jgi:hypothetical protein
MKRCKINNALPQQNFYNLNMVISQVQNMHPKAPLCANADYVDEPNYKTRPNASKWASTSNSTYGAHDITNMIEKAENRLASVLIDTSPLEVPTHFV